MAQITISREKFLSIAPWLENFADDRTTTRGNILIDLDDGELQKQVPGSVFDEILKHASTPQYQGAHRVANPAPEPSPKSVESPNSAQAEEKVLDFDFDKLQRDGINASVEQYETQRAEKLIEHYFQIGLDRNNKDVIFKWFRENKAKPTVENVQRMIKEIGHAGSNTLTWTKIVPAPVVTPVPPAPPLAPPTEPEPQKFPDGESYLRIDPTKRELYDASRQQLKEFVGRGKTPQQNTLASWQLPNPCRREQMLKADIRQLADLARRQQLRLP